MKGVGGSNRGWVSLPTRPRLYCDSWSFFFHNLSEFSPTSITINEFQVPLFSLGCILRTSYENGGIILDYFHSNGDAFLVSECGKAACRMPFSFSDANGAPIRHLRGPVDAIQTRMYE